MEPIDESGGIGLRVKPGTRTQRTLPAIYAWQRRDRGVSLQTVDVDDGRFILAIRSTRISAGFHNELALLNLTSDRSAKKVTVKMPSGTASNPGFHSPPYHSGEPYSGEPWTPSVQSSSVSWGSKTHTEDPNANALRWGTTYSYWFDSTQRPTSVTIGLFKPGTPSDVTVNMLPQRDNLSAWADAPDNFSISQGNSFQIVCRPGLDTEINLIADEKLVRVSFKKFTNGDTLGWDLNVERAKGAPEGYFETIVIVQSTDKRHVPIHIRVSGKN